MPPTEEDFQTVIGEARLIALRCKHGFIHYDHLFAAILTTDCPAHDLSTAIDSQQWMTWLEKLYPNEGPDGEDITLPITIMVEKIIDHATLISRKTGDSKVNSVHLLLAVLSFSSEVSEAFNKAGVTFDDVVAGYGKNSFKKFPPPLPSLKLSSGLSRLFNRKKVDKATLDEAIKVANLYLVYGLNDQCIDACKVGLTVAPGNGALLHGLWQAYTNKRSFPEALSVIGTMMKQSPEEKNHRINYAYIYQMMGEFQKADEVFVQLLAEFPEDAHILMNAGYNLSRLGRYTEAAAVMEKALAIGNPHAYLLDNLGFAKYKLGQVQEGLALIERSLDIDRGNSYAYKNKGIIFFEQGQHDESLKQFKLALKYGYPEKYGNEVNDYLEKLGESGRA